jgi:ABC-type uncharacterized transport system substrate-binding protein
MEYQPHKIFNIPPCPGVAARGCISLNRTRGSGHQKRAGMRRARYLLFALLVLLLNTEVHAASSGILILKSGQENIYSEIVDTFAAHLKESCKRQSNDCFVPALKIVSLNEYDKADEERLLRQPWQLIVTVGGKAAARIAEHPPSTPVLHTVLPHKTLNYVYRNRSSARVSAIFVDQPFARKLALVRIAMPESKRIGILITANSEVDREWMQKQAAKFSLTLQFGVVDSEQQIGNVLRETLEQSDVLLALPDPSIFNQSTVKSILLSSYHNRVPVVGFSMAYVKAGAIAAVYSSPEEIGEHIGESIGQFLKQRGRITPTHSYPKYFSITTNKSVAESLKILLPPAEIIESKLEESGL